MITIKKGLDIPLSGAPLQQINPDNYVGNAVKTVAVIGPDYIGMRPTMAVKEGDKVALGQVLFEDKKNPGVVFTAPAAGTVSAINRGEKRVFESVVIEVDDEGEEKTFASHSIDSLDALERQNVVSQLVESGQWVALRTRPYSKIPAIDSAPVAIFVTAVDTNPLAADPSLVIKQSSADFQAGIKVLTCLTEGQVFVCTGESDIPVPQSGKVHLEQFGGIHPAGNAGTHIHFLRPASLANVVWTIGYQDVIAVGKLFTTADGSCAFLGRYANQVSVLLEGEERPMLHYVSPGKDRFSNMPIYLSRLNPKRLWNFTTTTNGSERAMVPIGAYEKVMPLDILPTQLLRAIIVGDTAVAQQLGALELDEEDLALCTFVCPGKYEYGPILRDNLERIEREG